MSLFRIDCATCSAKMSGCADCVLSLLLPIPESPVSSAAPTAQFEPDEVFALRQLASQDLLPPLRWAATG
ncbi:MAG: hypothetical protein LBU38_00020 [Propionibacteriaceae bacterium]|jgi:hypothetical protein|nr:hypothetical protein [Propionibacteriaceae bacterium]